MADSEDENLDLFREPEGYFKPAKESTVVSHTTLSGERINLHLIGDSPLWGHLLWQGGRTVADFLEEHKIQYINGKLVLELGAGAGLPSLVCAINGAKQVVVTDYPDSDLIDNLRTNIKDCSLLPRTPNIQAEGYLWGADTSTVTAQLPDGETEFDLLILADLLFNHSEHAKLLGSIQMMLKCNHESQALVFFTPYRPWLLEKDLAFFELARSGGFVVEKILEKVMDRAMFEEDPGDELLRKTVFGYRLRWTDEIVSAAGK